MSSPISQHPSQIHSQRPQIDGLQSLFDQIELWYALATASDLQQRLEITMFAANRTVNQIDVRPCYTHRGTIVNDLRD